MSIMDNNMDKIDAYNIVSLPAFALVAQRVI
jgi:hypothetical protein